MVKQSDRVWVVVSVWKGFAEATQVFASKSDAQSEYARLSRRQNFDENDVQLIETRIVPPARETKLALNPNRSSIG
jgi:hypothetical protein